MAGLSEVGPCSRADAKARRGELRISVPIGNRWHRECGLGLDPDLRVQAVLARYSPLPHPGQRPAGSAVDERRGDHFPRRSDCKKLTSFEWTPVHNTTLVATQWLKRAAPASPAVRGRSQRSIHAHRVSARPSPPCWRRRRVGRRAPEAPYGVHTEALFDGEDGTDHADGTAPSVV